MKITKLGHCCLLIEENSHRFLTDPGVYSTEQNELKNIHYILITHEHPDHLHMDSVQRVLNNNPTAKVITNTAVSALLTKEDIKAQVLKHGQQIMAGNVLIEGFGQKHADVYRTVVPVDNVGFFINNRLFYPGDNFTNPEKAIEILALPVSGPWLKLSESIEYALNLKPKKCFPVHDGMLKQPGLTHVVPKAALSNAGIEFLDATINTAFEI